MTNVAISALPAASALDGTELVPIVQGGVTSQTTALDVAKLAETSLYAATASETVANTSSETPLIGTGTGSLTLPADFLAEGRTLKLWATGFQSSVLNPNLTLKVKLGSVIIGTTGVIAAGTVSSSTWELTMLVTCRTTGATGTVLGQGSYEIFGTAIGSFGIVNTSVSTVDTTGTLDVAITAQWGTASSSNTITCTNFLLEASTPD
jgi:hypothetical protein